MMKIKLREIIDMQNSLGVLVQLKVPAKVAFKLGKAAKQVNVEFQDFNKAREDLIMRLGTKNEDKQLIEVPPEKIEEFRREIQSLLEEDVSLDFEPISLDCLGEATLSAADMANLSPFFTDSESKG